MGSLRAATRGSRLARAQTDLVAELLGTDVQSVVIDTQGDRRIDVPIWELGGRGVFVKEVQAAVLEGRADFAVHSAKDLPSSTPEGLTLACVPERADPRDALVGGRFDTLPPGARIGTGSVRRRAQLAWLRPDLTFGGLRGNMETRLSKADGFAAIVVAAAALDRLGRSSDVTEILGPQVMVPQVGQGALAIECRADDDDTLAALATIEHGPSRKAVDAERAWLAEVGGGCDLPVGAHATVDDRGHVTLTAMLGTPDGRIVLRDSDEGDDPVELGRRLARHLLDDAGGSTLLADLR
ncbi:MAG TPA: hydroxymethylbilane synthase [Acidimicrobiales bacterium]|nr:hydroxymethylbilane synthase [Acidimicrobiales bacterium]